MSNIELTSKIENIKTLQTMIDELTAEMESAKDEIKAEMTAKGVRTARVVSAVNHYSVRNLLHSKRYSCSFKTVFDILGRDIKADSFKIAYRFNGCQRICNLMRAAEVYLIVIALIVKRTAS